MQIFLAKEVYYVKSSALGLGCLWVPIKHRMYELSMGTHVLIVVVRVIFNIVSFCIQ